MGFGDDLMATGLARTIQQEHPDVKVVFGNPENYIDKENNKLRVHFTEVFLDNPHIVQPGEPVKNMVCVPDYPGNRVYIDYENCEVGKVDKHEFPLTAGQPDEQILRFQWLTDYRAVPGDMHFDENEMSHASEIAMRLPQDYFIIEPNIAEKPWPNKKGWPIERWQAVVDALPDVPFIQVSQGEMLRGVHQVLTPTFRLACGLLSCAGGVISTDGGLHHAAAALSVPAVVLWGHYSSPDIFGYDDHTNIRHADGIGCGCTFKECPDCEQSMHDIKVDEVVEAIKRIISDGRHQDSRATRNRPVFRMVGEAPQGEEE